jgi:hypothetical protein
VNQRIDRRLSVVEERAARIPPPRSAEVAEGERAFLDALGIAGWFELPCDDLFRIVQLAEEAPGFAHPLIARACIAKPEDREPEPERPDRDASYCEDPRCSTFGKLCGRSTCTVQGPRAAPRPDTPSWRGYILWRQRYWGYVTADGDPEAVALCDQLQAWAVSPDRPYLRGADLRFLFSRLGVDWPEMRFYELKRLVALCDALDELAREHPELDVPPEVFWAVLGWGEGDRRRCGGHPA